ncbi:hypothetical protein SLITO_v1c10250 [Spiroplasma litorale]|uniref:Uncharacterized protein n=1 Tax=Spiroplasma litorale TaxID=216942 RepID=A0A0K1W370_9MOLU|nr:hypothetical protein [Spiroplasma litorale]AKX34636.1 hypothetical protein SLITO_v1c10250 [Spiroplasma litorale]
MKKYNDSFRINKKLIKNMLYINKNMTMFFSVLYLLTIVPLIGFLFINNYDFDSGFFIAPTSINYEKFTGGNFGSTKMSIYSITHYVAYEGPGQIIFLIANIVFVNKIIIKELNDGQMTMWLTFKTSRKNIILSKILSIVINNLIIFAPSFIILLVFSTLSMDASQNLGLMFYQSIQFIVINLLLLSIILFFSILFNEKNTLLNIVFALIGLYILIGWVLNIVDEFMGGEIKLLSYVKYFQIQYLVFMVMNFDYNQTELLKDFEWNNNGVVSILQSKNHNINWYLSTIFPMILLLLIFGLIYLSINKFNNKDIKI